MISKDKLSSKNRQELVDYIKKTNYDLVVIGGGVTGAGIALDAVTRGVSTLLIEKEDYASGTSSRSTKLIHGGLRYLKQLELGLVKETGQERAIVHNMAPHLTIPEKMLLPLTKTGSLGKTSTSIALKVYDFLADVEDSDKRKMLEMEQVLEMEPLLEGNTELVGGAIYAEYRTDDARLTIELIKKATLYGADCINYVAAKELSYNSDGFVDGLKLEDQISGETFDITAKVVVNATGPWGDIFRKKDKSLSERQLHLTKGVHLVVPWERLPVKQALYFDVPDGRMIFTIPRQKITYIGTTDTTYKGDVNRITANMEDAEYLIKAVNNMIPSSHLKIEDVVSTWAGLRPLIHQPGKSASEISRKDEMFESKSGMITIAGGKLTGFRKMAERVTDRVLVRLIEKTGNTFDRCSTENMKLEGNRFKKYSSVKKYIKELAEDLKELGYSKSDARYLIHNYGTQAEDILDRLKDKKRKYSLVGEEAVFCIKREMVQNLRDFYIRRTGRLYFDIGSIEPSKDEVLGVFQDYLGWDDAKSSEEWKSMEDEIGMVLEFKEEIVSS
ncbi:MAG: glycerol-3-phosphate dehydrogenase/oxidase [Bacteroidota bacterium]